jgi:hypothetical protein
LETQTATGLTEQQIAYFETFGFVLVRGLFREDVGWISSAFEEIFASEGHPRMETYVELHGEKRRTIIPQFISKHPALDALRADPRVDGIVTSLLGPEYEFAESDGNRFDCESLWHSDTYGAPMTSHYVKLSFYLDPLRAETGAIRVIPGSQFFRESFAKALRAGFREPAQIEDHFGVPASEIPSVTLETDPGDLVVWDFRAVHASFGGGVGRRLFSINYRQRDGA